MVERAFKTLEDAEEFLMATTRAQSMVLAAGENGYFQPANFILRNRKVDNATYSSGPLGRLQAQHVLMLVGMAEKTEAELELELTGEQMKEFKKIQES